MSLPEIMTLAQFKSQTYVAMLRRRIHLVPIDSQLQRVHQTQNNLDDHIKQLIILIDECKIWQQSKAQKFGAKPSSENFEKRNSAVQFLLNAAFTRLKFAAFQTRKNKGVSDNVASLGAGYDRERHEFSAMKSRNPGGSINPQSAAFVDAGARSVKNGGSLDYSKFDANLQPLLFKSLDQLNPAEFTTLKNELQAKYGVQLNAFGYLPRVHYVRKQERINLHMLIPMKGLLYGDAANPYTTRQGGGADAMGKIADLYAVDKYGNIIVAPSDMRDGDAEFRHSSLNAGNSVMCAGRIEIYSGKIWYIDNASGHYKPTPQQLATAINFLIFEQSLDLSKTIVKVFKDTGQPQTFGSGHSFVAAMGQTSDGSSNPTDNFYN